MVGRWALQRQRLPALLPLETSLLKRQPALGRPALYPARPHRPDMGKEALLSGPAAPRGCPEPAPLLLVLSPAPQAEGTSYPPDCSPSQCPRPWAPRGEGSACSEP